jgi:hypothetical protein
MFDARSLIARSSFRGRGQPHSSAEAARGAHPVPTRRADLLRRLAAFLVGVGLSAAPTAAQQFPPPDNDFINPGAKWLENDHLVPPKPSAAGGDPVVLATGNLFIQETDLVVPGRGMDLVIGRSYRSGAADNTRLGHRWTSSLFETITIGFAEFTTYFDPESGHTTFGPPKQQYLGSFDILEFESFRYTGTFYRNGQLRIDTFRGGVDASNKILGSPAGLFATLKYDGGFTPQFNHLGIVTGFTVPNRFELRGHDGTIRTFGIKEGSVEYENAICYRLMEIVDRFGNRQEFHYSTRTSPLGGSSNALDYVLDTYGRKTTLEYDSNG